MVAACQGWLDRWCRWHRPYSQRRHPWHSPDRHYWPGNHTPYLSLSRQPAKQCGCFRETGILQKIWAMLELFIGANRTYIRRQAAQDAAAISARRTSCSGTTPSGLDDPELASYWSVNPSIDPALSCSFSRSNLHHSRCSFQLIRTISRRQGLYTCSSGGQEDGSYSQIWAPVQDLHNPINGLDGSRFAASV